MSVVGFDLGNENCLVAVARQRGIDVVLNDESKRETPAIVCFGDKQRFIGTAGAAMTMMNPKNSISQIKRFIGRQFSDPDLQRDLKSLPFSVTEDKDGYPLIHAQYLGEVKTFTPTQVLAMVLSDLKVIAEKNLNTAVVDCCIGIPVYFTDLQRRAVLDAATIAGLHPLRLMHETTATALAYGIYKTDLPETDQLNVAFVDIGHASMQVCIAGFKKGQLKILSHAFDRSLGGRDFDDVLFHHFAEKFKVEYKIDVYQNARACLKLRSACEKLKKIHSANPEAPLNIECLMEEKDVRGFIKKDEMEQIGIPILERVRRLLEKALQDAGLSVENVHTVEVIGSGSRVPAIIKILTEFFGKEPRRTMNASECVARGCALECAILSPIFKVREFKVNQSFPFSVSLSWKGPAPDSDNGAVENQQSTLVFPKGNPIPSTKALTFYRSGTFTVDVQYSDVSELQAPAKISTYTIGPFQATKGERAKVKVKARLNLHGIVSVESATLLEEEEVVYGAMSPADAPKKKVTKTNIHVSEHVFGAMTPADVQKAVEKEFEMALQDRVMEETKDKKNALDAYVYEMRNKLNDKYQEFVTDSEKKEFLAKLQETKDWLYEDGEDETKGVYIAKLEELKKQGDPIEERYKEYSERGSVIDQLVYCVNSYREAAVSNNPKFDHIDLAEKQKVLNVCVEAEAWLREKKQQQDSLPKFAPPVLLFADVRRKAEAIDRVCRPIMTKPKPAKPATPETPVTPHQGSEQQGSPAPDEDTKADNGEVPHSGEEEVDSLKIKDSPTSVVASSAHHPSLHQSFMSVQKSMPIKSVCPSSPFSSEEFALCRSSVVHGLSGFLRKEFQDALSSGFSNLKAWWERKSSILEEVIKDVFMSDAAPLKLKVEDFLTRVDSYLTRIERGTSCLPSPEQIDGLKLKLDASQIRSSSLQDALLSSEVEMKDLDLKISQLQEEKGRLASKIDKLRDDLQSTDENIQKLFAEQEEWKRKETVTAVEVEAIDHESEELRRVFLHMVDLEDIVTVLV